MSVELGVASIESDDESIDPAPVPIELESSSSISISEDEGVLVEFMPEPVPVLASEPIVELDGIEESEGSVVLSEETPEPIDVESVVEDEDDVVVFAIAGTAKAATMSDVQINFFIKPP